MLHLLLDRPLAKGIVSLKKTFRSWSSLSRELNEPFAGRSQSVQSLSPGVTIAADFKALKYPSPC